MKRDREIEKQRDKEKERFGQGMSSPNLNSMKKEIKVAESGTHTQKKKKFLR
jgi:hypothetical protein